MIAGRLYAGALPYDDLRKLVDSIAGAPAASGRTLSTHRRTR
jgi:hypothetical protein